MPFIRGRKRKRPWEDERKLEEKTSRAPNSINNNSNNSNNSTSSTSSTSSTRNNDNNDDATATNTSGRVSSEELAIVCQLVPQACKNGHYAGSRNASFDGISSGEIKTEALYLSSQNVVTTTLNSNDTSTSTSTSENTNAATATTSTNANANANANANTTTTTTTTTTDLNLNSQRQQELLDALLSNPQVCILIPALCVINGTLNAPSSSPSSSLQPTVTAYPTPVISLALVPTMVLSQNPTEEPSMTPSVSPSMSPFIAPTLSQIPTLVPSKSPTASNLPSISILPTLSAVPTISISPSISMIPSIVPSLHQDVRSCPKWEASQNAELIKQTTLDFTYTVQITSLAATFIPEMEELLLDIVSRQVLACPQPQQERKKEVDTDASTTNTIVRMAYPDPSSTISACEPSVFGAKSCWTVASQFDVWSPQSKEAEQQVMSAIRYEFDFGEAVQVVIPNNVFIELLKSAVSDTDGGLGKEPVNELSAGAAIGVTLVLIVMVLSVGAYVKVQRWRSVNARLLTRQTKGSHRQSAVEGFFPGGWSSDDAVNLMDQHADNESSDDEDGKNYDDDDSADGAGSDGYQASETNGKEFRSSSRILYGNGKSISSSGGEETEGDNEAFDDEPNR